MFLSAFPSRESRLDQRTGLSYFVGPFVFGFRLQGFRGWVDPLTSLACPPFMIECTNIRKDPDAGVPSHHGAQCLGLRCYDDDYYDYDSVTLSSGHSCLNLPGTTSRTPKTANNYPKQTESYEGCSRKRIEMKSNCTPENP